LAIWAAVVNEPIAPPMLERMQLSVKRGQPYGTERWTQRIAKCLGLESALQNPWRPKKKDKKARKTTRAIPFR